MIKIGIDASNIRSGGGVTHLVELLSSADPKKHSFASIILWAPKSTLQAIEPRPWLELMQSKEIEGNLFWRTIWQCRVNKRASHLGCHMMFVPGGIHFGKQIPYVVMSQNLLPFQLDEIVRYGFSIIGLRLIFIRLAQTISILGSQGCIYLTEHAKVKVESVIGRNKVKSYVVPHGLNARFKHAPRKQREIDTYNNEAPFRLLYVSPIEPYKHHIEVVDAVFKLRSEGFPICLDLIGGAYEPSLQKLEKRISELDKNGNIVSYKGILPHHELPRYYQSADLFVFASSCETFGQVLLEAMLAGLPCACSSESAMYELLGDGGLYFAPNDSDQIASTLRKMISSPLIREQLANKSFERAERFSWAKCADETFKIINKCLTIQNAE